MHPGQHSLLPLCIASLSAALLACSNEASPQAAANANARPSPEIYSASLPEASAANEPIHDPVGDCTLGDDAGTRIRFAEDGISVAGSGATVAGNTVTIGASGTYRLQGQLDDGQLIVATADEDVVRLVLEGLTLRSATGAPLAILEAKQAVVLLADGSENFLGDPASYVFPSAESDEPNAALFSAADLTLCGGGQLRIEGNHNDGIASKDGLLLRDASIIVTATDDALRGKDYVVVESGLLDLSAGGDGVKSDNEEDAERGFVQISGGELRISAGGDAIAAQTDALISSGTLHLRAGGGSSAANGDVSAKGIKALVNLIVAGGSIEVDAADDALHSNGAATISGGDLSLKTGDDGVHADLTLAIVAGAIDLTESYEGLESQEIHILGGKTRVVANDDGVNAASGSTQSSAPAAGGPAGAGSIGDFRLLIAGGELEVDASGDGLDSNGSATISGGVVVVHGPTGSANSALDCNGNFSINGGTLASAHVARMADEIEGSSTQNYLQLGIDSEQAGGSLVHLRDADGTEVLTFAPKKAFKALVLSTPLLQQGEHQLYLGGADSAAASMGLYESGGYTEGTLLDTFTVTTTRTIVGEVSPSFRPGRL